jgi:hypothetical protein
VGVPARASGSAGQRIALIAIPMARSVITAIRTIHVYTLSSQIHLARRINPALEVISLSAKSGAGLRPWYDWIDKQRMAVSSKNMQ